MVKSDQFEKVLNEIIEKETNDTPISKPKSIRINNSRAYNELMKKDFEIDEQYTKVNKRQKYDKVRNNIPPLANYNQMADLLMLPTTKEGYRYLLVVVDLYSNLFDCQEMKIKSDEDTLDALKTIYKRKIIKIPYATLSTDNGSEFKGDVSKWLFTNNIFNKKAKPYRHQQQSVIENLNKLLGRFLNNYMNKIELETGEQYNEWTDIIPMLRDKLNKIRKIDDKNPFTYEYAQPIDAIPKYKIGDLVYHKLDRPKSATNNDYDGKFRMGDLRYNIFEPRKVYKILYYPINIRYILEGIPQTSYAETELLPAKEKEKESRYTVKKIIGKKTENRKIYYLIWWDKYLKKQSTWEPKTELISDGLSNTIKIFEKNEKDKAKNKK